MEWRLNRRSPGMDWRLNKRGMDWRLNKKGMEWRLNKRAFEDEDEYILERMQPILETILRTQKKMQVMEESNTDSKFWEDQMNFPVMFQQLFRMGHMHTIIMKEMVCKM